MKETRGKICSLPVADSSEAELGPTRVFSHHKLWALSETLGVCVGSQRAARFSFSLLAFSRALLAKAASSLSLLYTQVVAMYLPTVHC